MSTKCATEDLHLRHYENDPEYHKGWDQSQSEISQWITNYGKEYGEKYGVRGIIRIPVVVHIIYNTDEQNISDERIKRQLEIVNEDYRRLNKDASETPKEFAAVAADACLEFALAARDPNCHFTTGITRTHTSVTGFDSDKNGDDMKASATHGHDPWDPEKYLNIWIINITNQVTGWATYPTSSKEWEKKHGGVCIHYEWVGTGQNHRILTEEIGHWLDLRHIWGDDDGTCDGDDYVDDTPNQAGPSSDCPTFPQISCENGSNGNMFMNFMDYTGSTCRNMFTLGQVRRMHATLHTLRASILSSQGLVPVGDGTMGPDLWMQDVSDDIGNEPDMSKQPMFISDDIWVRNQDDGIENQETQNAQNGITNYVYVRVRNRGCSGETATGKLKLYWAKASTGLSWPAPWDGSVRIPAVMGGEIGPQDVSVTGGEANIYKFKWMPPNPSDYASFGADKTHFCLLGRIETKETAPYGMTSPETSNLYANVQNNNNIVWKNINVVNEVPGSGLFSSAIIANFTNKIEYAYLAFVTPENEGTSIFEWGKVFVDIPPGLIQIWKDKDQFSQGIDEINPNTFQILKSGAQMAIFKLAPMNFHTIVIRFEPTQQDFPLGVRIFTLDIEQRANERVIGGQRFVVKSLPDI